MSLLTPLFLFGILAAGIPVIIHMIHSARAPRVPFPTLRFLKSAAEKTARRRKIENLLLLILRMLLFALLALALSRPFIEREFGLFGKTETSAVIVLDNSYSMNVTYKQRTRYSRAKREAKAILESKYQPTSCAIILTNPAGRPLPESLLTDRGELFHTIEQSSASGQQADLPASLRYAYKLLDKSKGVSKRLYIITDRQKLSWNGIEELEVMREHKSIPVAVIRLGEPEFSNVGITDVAVRSVGRVIGLSLTIDVRVKNSTNASEHRNVLLYVEKDFSAPGTKRPASYMKVPKRSRSVELKPAGTPGASKAVTFGFTFFEAGVYRCMVELDQSDSLLIDNRRRFTLRVADRVSALLVKDSHAAVPFQDDNYYLMPALDPMFGVVGGPPWAIVPKEKLTSEVTEEDLGANDLVVINNVGEINEALARDLAAYVAAGHTVVFFLGPRTDLEKYNKLLFDNTRGTEALLPAKLLSRVGNAVRRDEAEGIADVEEESPYLKGLVDKAAIYQDILVYEHVRMDMGEASSTEVLLRLKSGDPLLVHKPYGRGHVLLFTTTANTAWSNLPIPNLFLPMMVRIAHLSIRSEGFEGQVHWGSPLRLDFYPGRRDKVEVNITNPQGAITRVRSSPAGTSNVATFDDTHRLGFYSYALPGTTETGGAIAVNQVGKESDLAESSDEELHEQIHAEEKYIGDSFATLKSRFEKSVKEELWQYFLVACLILAVFECLIANWIRPGRGQPSPIVR